MRCNWALAAILFGCLLRPAICTAAADALWNQVEFQEATGDQQAALMTLAQLTTIPSEKAEALQRASSLCIKMGRINDAIKILEELVRIPGWEFNNSALVQLYYSERRFAEIVTLAQAVSSQWDETAAGMVREAFIHESMAVPELTVVDQLPRKRDYRKINSQLLLSYMARQYSPFREGTATEDREFMSMMGLDFGFPVKPKFRLMGHVAARREWSEDHPESFDRYDTDVLQLGMKAELKPTKGLTLGGGVDHSTFDVEEGDTLGGWGYDLTAKQKLKSLTLNVGVSRFVFGDASYDGYAIERLDSWQVGLRYAPKDLGVWDLSYRDRRFKGDIEDYGLIGGGFRFQATDASYIRLGAERELRDRDQNLLESSIDWIRILTPSSNIYAQAAFEANLATHERQAELQLVWSLESRWGNTMLGLSYQNEFNIYDQQGLYLYLMLER